MSLFFDKTEIKSHSIILHDHQHYILAALQHHIHMAGPEMNLIKRHRPRYNVRLKDDKRYPYIKIHWGEPYPKLTVTRQMLEDGSRYYGPYTSAWAL